MSWGRDNSGEPPEGQKADLFGTLASERAAQFSGPAAKPPTTPPVPSGQDRPAPLPQGSSFTWELPKLPSPSAEILEPGGLTSGQKILNGRYRVENFIDRGGMGEVWQVRHLGLNRIQVLKLI